jgi:hypothetical protein
MVADVYCGYEAELLAAAPTTIEILSFPAVVARTSSSGLGANAPPHSINKAINVVTS